MGVASDGAGTGAAGVALARARAGRGCGLQEAARAERPMCAVDGIEAVRSERRERACLERIISVLRYM